jgi:hypothetical protein
VSDTRSVYILIFICVVSLALQSPVLLNIYNQFQGINLSSPVYFIHGGRWHVTPDQEIDADVVMRNYIEFDSGHDILEGALVYRIQRQHVEYDKSAQDKSKSIQLLVAWHVEHTKKLDVRAVLVEHEKELNEDKLRRLHQKYWHLFKGFASYIKSNRLLDDATVLGITVKTMNGGYRRDIFISKGIKSNVLRPLWFDTER